MLGSPSVRAANRGAATPRPRGERGEPETHLGEELQCSCMGVQEIRPETLPVSLAREWAYLLEWLAAFVTPLEEIVPWVFIRSKGAADALDDGHFVAHGGSLMGNCAPTYGRSQSPRRNAKAVSTNGVARSPKMGLCPPFGTIQRYD